ncbi:mitotic interactor and substrate of PLK1 [Ochotona princeps]|uniref:mitotic interactor and substrate of PLK1 n=1 Tax=Ochotona princeps TaxID=9978 RepID=UPI00271453FE|nr:mitotic interactor and substrate of PLK1 [Ochotona princeps]
MAGARIDRVTRHPIFSIPHSARVTGLALDEDASYTIELVGVGSEAGGWRRGESEVWPEDRNAQLEEGVGRRWVSSSSERAFAGQPLYLPEEEEEKELAYYLGPKGAPTRWPREPEMERWTVVQEQVVSRNGTVASLGATPGHGDVQPSFMPLEDSSIDREQIDFLSARKQFLLLEQENAGVPWSPPARVSAAPKAFSGHRLANGHVSSAEKEVDTENSERGRSWLPAPRDPPRDDPGRSSWLPPPREDQGRGTWLSAPRDPPREDPGRGGWLSEPPDPPREDPVASTEPPKETPIEREIRLAQEREEALRAQRGLRGTGGAPELVHIPTRQLLASVSLSEAPRRERGRPSLYVQRDMVQGTQREEDHRRQGLQTGRAATPDALDGERQPGLRRAFSSDSVLGPTSPDARAADPAPEVRKVNRIPPDAYQPYLSPGGPPLEFSAFGVPRRPAGVHTQVAKATITTTAAAAAAPKPPGEPLQADGAVVRGQYFRLQPLRFGVPGAAPPVEATPRVGAREAARAWEAAGASPWRLQRSASSDLLEREVESVLRREREVAEERRGALLSSADESWEPSSRSSSRASGITGSYSVSESPLVSPVHLHSGLVWRAEAPAEPTQRPTRRSWYAGINPSDGINSEVLGATRVTRHKNYLAERWEAGIYASEDED